MSSVVVCSQMWMPELSVEFFNVNCRWQLAVVYNLPYMANVFVISKELHASTTAQRFRQKSRFWDFFGKCFFTLEVFFWFGGTLLLTLTTTRPSLNTRIEILMFLKKMFFLTLRTYKQASKHFILETKCKGLSFIIVDCARSFRNTCF